MISNDFLIYGMYKSQTYSLHIKSISEDKLICSSEEGFRDEFIQDNNLYYSNCEQYYCYNILSENLNVISSEEYLSFKNKDFSFTKDEDQTKIHIEDKNHSINRTITTRDLCKNSEINDLNNKIRREILHGLHIECAMEFQNSIYIVVCINYHDKCFTVKFDYDTDNFEIVDVFKWYDETCIRSVCYLEEGHSEVLDYLLK